MVATWEIIGFIMLVIFCAIGISTHYARRPPPEIPLDAETLSLHLEMKALEDRIAFLESIARCREDQIEKLRAQVESPHVGPGAGRPALALSRMLLGLDPERRCSRKEVRRAYVAAMKRHHPDHGGSAMAFQMVQEAYDALLEDAA